LCHRRQYLFLKRYVLRRHRLNRRSFRLERQNFRLCRRLWLLWCQRRNYSRYFPRLHFLFPQRRL
jgi:hypothetical protein